MESIRVQAAMLIPVDELELNANKGSRRGANSQLGGLPASGDLRSRAAAAAGSAGRQLKNQASSLVHEAAHLATGGVHVAANLRGEIHHLAQEAGAGISHLKHEAAAAAHRVQHIIHEVLSHKQRKAIEQAVTKLQAIMRGKITRRLLAERKRSEFDEKDYEAAVCLQAHFRGRLTREAVEEAKSQHTSAKPLKLRGPTRANFGKGQAVASAPADDDDEDGRTSLVKVDRACVVSPFGGGAQEHANRLKDKNHPDWSLADKSPGRLCATTKRPINVKNVRQDMRFAGSKGINICPTISIIWCAES